MVEQQIGWLQPGIAGSTVTEAARLNVMFLDLRGSMEFRKSHIPGSRWSIRPCLPQAVYLERRQMVVVADDGDLARWCVAGEWPADLAPPRLLDGGFKAWRDAGLNPYGNSIIVNPQFLQKNRAAIDKFVKANRTAEAFADLAAAVSQLRPAFDRQVAKEAELRIRAAEQRQSKAHILSVVDDVDSGMLPTRDTWQAAASVLDRVEVRGPGAPRAGRDQRWPQGPLIVFAVATGLRIVCSVAITSFTSVTVLS